jgi:acetyl esterase/lipase
VAELVRVHEGVTYAELPGFRPLLLDLHLPADAGPGPGAARPVPVVVWIHGGAFLSGDRRYLPDTLPPGSVFEALTAAGMAVATVDYRLSGEALFPAQLDDVRAALAFLRANSERWGLDPERIGVWGESAGGLLAALAALGAGGPTGVAAAALWYSVTDLVVLDGGPDHPASLLIGGTPRELPDAARAASPTTHVSFDAPPFLLLHGVDDGSMPYAQSELLHRRLLAAGASATLVPVAGADHVFAGHPEPLRLVEQTVAWLASVLAADGTSGQGGGQ